MRKASYFNKIVLLILKVRFIQGEGGELQGYTISKYTSKQPKNSFKCTHKPCQVKMTAEVLKNVMHLKVLKNVIHLKYSIVTCITKYLDQDVSIKQIC